MSTPPDEMPGTPYDNPDMSSESGIDPTEEPDTKPVADRESVDEESDDPESSSVNPFAPDDPEER